MVTRECCAACMVGGDFDGVRGAEVGSVASGPERGDAMKPRPGAFYSGLRLIHYFVLQRERLRNCVVRTRCSERDAASVSDGRRVRVMLSSCGPECLHLSRTWGAGDRTRVHVVSSDCGLFV